ncbi:EamA family transporter [Laceyella putida]|uniref:EamA family transporter n=1 Tax=Laceyella putida TaxID=110101 RepID=A0ABW2RPF7_9BACL
MWFILALFSSLTFGLAGFMMKISSHHKGSNNYLLLGLYVSGALGFLWWMLQTGVALFTWPIILFGIMIGFGSAVGNLLFMKALEVGPASLTAPLTNSNIVLTVAMSILIYDEAISWTETIGVVLLVTAISLLPIDPNESLRIRNIAWYGFVLTATLLFFLRNGGLKITEELHLPNATILFISYVVGIIWFGVGILRGGQPEPPRARSIGWWWGLGAGVFSFAGLQIYSIALSKGPASIIAPIFATNSLIVALLSILIYRERLSLMQSFCLVLLFSGLIFIRI